jgi:PAS domain S-box-containing protein
VATGTPDIHRDLVDTLDAIFWEADPRTLQFTTVSPKAEALLGYLQPQWTSSPTFWADIIHPDDRERTLVRRVLAIKRCEDHRLDYRVITADGRTRAIRDTVRVKCDRGRPKHVYGLMIDVTASPEPQQPELVTGRDELEERRRQGQKMEAVGRLAGAITHDFNNLLTVILGCSELVLHELAPGTQVHRDMQEIRHAGASASALTRQLLAFSRKQVVQPQMLDLNEIVSRMNTLLGRLISEDVDLAIHLATPLDRVLADPGQIEQIILNLALNARDAMPNGGVLTIETANTDLDAHWVAQHPGASEGHHVMLLISDNGIGMDETVQAHLFEPFFTTKEDGQGTGLGLATVYDIVKQSGGSIFVDSQPERGTTFMIVLPRAEPSADLPSASQPEPRSLGGTETILLVEDQPKVRAVIRDILARRGYQVLEGANGDEALSVLKTHQGEVHLLLTDVVMRGMSGRDLAEQLAATRPRLRILYMSGYTDDTIVHHGVLEAGMAFIQKPFTATVLLQKIRDLIDAR